LILFHESTISVFMYKAPGFSPSGKIPELFYIVIFKLINK